MSRQKYGLPPQVFTDDPDTVSDSTAQLRTDICPTSFEQNRQFKLIYEFSISQAQVYNWIKFQCPIDFDLVEENLSVDSGAVQFRAYATIVGEQNSPTWTDQSENVIQQNSKSNAPVYARQATIEAEVGDVVNVGSNAPKENVRLRSSGATAQAATVDAGLSDIRGFPAGTYYLGFQNIGGSGDVTGIYTLRYAEVPSSVYEWLDDYKGT